MADQIVITEKTSQAKDVRAAIGSRYGDFFQLRAICSISSNRRTLFRPGSGGRRYFYDLKAFTERARQRVATRPLSSTPFARHCARPNEFGLPPIVTARVS